MGEKVLLNKKLMMLTIFFVSLLVVSVVSAANNTTDIVGVEETTDDVVCVDNNELDNNDTSIEIYNNEYNLNDVGEQTLQSVEDDVISFENSEEVLGDSLYFINSFSCPSSINYGSKGTISIQLYPQDSNTPYSYNFYVEICNSYGSPKFWKQISGNTYDSPPALYNIERISFQFGTSELDPGSYTARLVDHYGGSVLAARTFTVKSVYPSGYSDPSDYSYCAVNVQDTNIAYGSSGTINMLVSCRLGYNFNLKVYDSKNNQKINANYYYNKGGTYSLSYTVGSNSLSSGVYTIKIINAGDNTVLTTAKLTIGSDNSNTPVTPIYSSDYLVSVKDTTKDYKYNRGFSVSLSPVSSNFYKYDFSFNVYDSKNVQKISSNYSGECNGAYSLSCSCNSLDVGTYTVKIINNKDKSLLATAKLTVRSIPHSDYSVSVNDSYISFGTDGKIIMNVSPGGNNYLKYDYYLKVYNSKNSEVISHLYGSTSSTYKSITYNVNGTSLAPGNYTIKLINHADGYVMDTANLTVTSVPYSAYSVSVDDVRLDCWSTSKISMSISPASSDYYCKYDFYLKVYDSNNATKINLRYYSNISSRSATCDIGVRSYSFNPGIYTIEIVNSNDNYVMDTAKLTVKSIPYSAYSVSVDDVDMEYGSNSRINIAINGSTKYQYKNDFYVKVYDSNNIEVISKRYFNSERYVSCKVNDTILSGNYTIKIVNSNDNYVMDTAILNVHSPLYSDYSVNITDIEMNYGWFNEPIRMVITPTSANYSCKYDFYLKVYDSNNIEQISNRYYNTRSLKSLTYTVGATDLVPGNYTIKIVNHEDNYVMDTAKLTVNQFVPTTIVASDLTTSFKGDKYLVLTLKDQYGNAIDGANLSVNLNGIKSLTTDSNGQVMVSTNDLSANNYVASISFNGNEIYAKSNANCNIVVNKDKTYLSANTVTTTFNLNNEFVVTLKDSHNKPIVNVQIAINLNGIKYLTTDKNGQVKLSTNGLAPNTYTATITFAGNNNYAKSTTTAKVTVKKATPKLTAKAKVFKKSVKTKKYTVTLKTNQNKVMKNTKVTIKVNKKTYSAKTNSKGVATFKITKLTKKGKYTATVTYKGSSYYNKLIKKVKITIK